jgi:hypothetical protein
MHPANCSQQKLLSPLAQALVEVYQSSKRIACPLGNLVEVVWVSKERLVSGREAWFEMASPVLL